MSYLYIRLKMASKVRQIYQSIENEFDNNDDTYDDYDDYNADNNDEYLNSEELCNNIDSEYYETETGIKKKLIKYSNKINIPTVNNSSISHNELDELNDFSNKHEMEKFKKRLSHFISKKLMKSTIIELPLKIDSLNIKKNSLVAIIDENMKRMEIRQNEKISKESEKEQISNEFEQEFIGKSKRQLLGIDRSQKETQKNKKILEINNLIGRIDCSINSIKNEIDEKQSEIKIIDTEIISISSKKTKLDRDIMKIDKKFHNELVNFDKDFEIRYDKFAKDKGWTIIRYKTAFYGSENFKNDLEKNLEVISDSDSESDSKSKEEEEEPSSPNKIDSIEENAFTVIPIQKPIQPSIPEPFRRAIIPIVCKPNFGCKPCKDGNICTRKNCMFLHEANHTPALGWKNKSELERIENIRYEQECDEYDYIWRKFKDDMKLWENSQMMKSVEAFPALGGGKK